MSKRSKREVDQLRPRDPSELSCCDVVIARGRAAGSCLNIIVIDGKLAHVLFLVYFFSLWLVSLLLSMTGSHYANEIPRAVCISYDLTVLFEGRDREGGVSDWSLARGRSHPPTNNLTPYNLYLLFIHS